ncbi:MAG: glycosyltransferase family 2 protein [Candidatus Kapaibacteriota bacterium]|jgi:GT2 family glycosyltransferase
MKISIVIFTRNRKGILEVALNKYKEQTYQNFEIILLDNGSTDGTPEMIREKFPEIQYIYFPDNLFLYAFNYGVTLASGDLIWRTDDDAYPQENTLFDDIVNKFKKYPEIDILATEIFEININQLSKWYNGKIVNNDIPLNGIEVPTFIGPGAMIKREIFTKIGGFWDFGFEETDFATRAIISGYNIRFFPQFVVNHFADPSSRNLADRRIKYAMQFTRYYTKYFPLSNIYINVIFIHIGFTLFSIFHKLGIKVLIEGNLSIITQMLKTFRTERIKINKKQLENITMGQSYLKNELYYVRMRIKKKYNI